MKGPQRPQSGCQHWVLEMAGWFYYQLIAFVFVLIIFNNHGTAYSIIYLPMMLILSYIASLALGYLRELKKKKKILNAFRKYVAPQVVEEIECAF